MKVKHLEWADWFRGMLSAAIQGISNAGLAWLGMLGANQIDTAIKPISLSQAGAIFFTGALVGLFTFWKQHPGPDRDIEDVDTTTLTKKDLGQ